jgi:hypothetical protein
MKSEATSKAGDFIDLANIGHACGSLLNPASGYSLSRLPTEPLPRKITRHRRTAGFA